MNQSSFIREKILELIRERPGLSAPVIAETLGVNRVTAFRHLQFLIGLSMIRTEGNRKSTRYFSHASVYIDDNISGTRKTFSPSEIQILKDEVFEKIINAYETDISRDDIDAVFEQYCMYIAPDDTILRGFDAFVAWCTDPKHNFANVIPSKAEEYIEIIRAIDARRKKNRFLEGTLSVQQNIAKYTPIGFDVLYFYEPAILTSGFGRTRPYIELFYGKANSNRALLYSAIEGAIDPIRAYVQKESVDAYIITPPTTPRPVQFRDALDEMMNLRIPKILTKKVGTLGRVLRAQKEIRGKDPKERIDNASLSLVVEIPKELGFYKHIAIFDDSFTTGATPNAIALKLRNAGYTGKITVITICGSFSYDLAITEDEI